MTTALTNEQRLARAQRAKEITEDEVFLEAVASVDKAYVDAWRNSTNQEAREDLHRKMIALHDVCKHLKLMMTDGAFTQKKIADLEGQSVVKRMFR